MGAGSLPSAFAWLSEIGNEVNVHSEAVWSSGLYLTLELNYERSPVARLRNDLLGLKAWPMHFKL